MRKVDELFERYGASHRNRTNEAIHWICVPLITWSVLAVAAVVFVLAWIGQFIGHAIEGKRPSFFEDVKFLLVGPAWLLHFIYRRVGIAY
jgi:uncharacterized membrane protein YGL010W